MLNFVTISTMLRIVVLLVLLLFVTVTFTIKLSCRDEHNRPVDWFVMYKLPMVKEANNKLVEDGTGYAYITSENEKGWTLSRRSLEDKKSIPGQTLRPLYENKSLKHMLYFMYNDQPPTGGTHSTGGHAKGVVAAGYDGGFWLVHSVPRFPNQPRGRKKYSFTESGTRNGQSFLCITLKPEGLESVAVLAKCTDALGEQYSKNGFQLMHNEIHVYSKYVPKSLRAKYSNLAAAAQQQRDDRSSNVLNIKSAYGQSFRIFAKSGKYHRELYTDLVAADLGVDLIVQTWPNSRTHQKSSCGRNKHTVENVDETRVDGVTFPSAKDHSKWAVSAEKSEPWVCVGDINKDDSQEKRGGGTVCTKDPTLWRAYHDTVVKVETCRRRRG